MPGKGRRQSPRSEIGAQAVLDDEEAERRRLEALLGVTDEKSRKVAESGRLREAERSCVRKKRPHSRRRRLSAELQNVGEASGNPRGSLGEAPTF